MLEERNRLLKDFLEAYRNKDKKALEVIDFAGTVIGNTVAALIDIFNPQAIAIGGNLSPFYEHLIPLIKSQVKKRSSTAKSIDTKIITIDNEYRVILEGCGEIVFQRWQVI